MAIINDDLLEERADWHEETNFKFPYEKALNYVKGKRVVDLCCGTGQGTRLLSTEAKSVVGYDYSETAIKRCLEDRPKNTIFMIQDVEDEDLDLSPYQVITCMQGLEHLNNPKKLIEKYKDKVWIFALPNEDGAPLIVHHKVKVTDELIKDWFGNKVKVRHFDDGGGWEPDNFTNFFGVYKP